MKDFEIKKWILHSSPTNLLRNSEYLFAIKFDFIDKTEQLFVSKLYPDVKRYATTRGNVTDYKISKDGYLSPPEYLSPPVPLLTTINIILHELDNIDIDCIDKSPAESVTASKRLTDIVKQSNDDAIVKSSIRALALQRESVYEMASLNRPLDLYLLDKCSPWIGTLRDAFGDFQLLIESSLDTSISMQMKKMRDCIEDDSTRKIMAFSCQSWYELVRATFQALAVNNMTINRCKLCGKVFIPENRTDELYCRFPNESYKSRPCRDVYKQLAKDKGNKGSEIIILNKRIYNRLLKRSPIKAQEYQSKRDAIREKVTQGELLKKDYLEWLQKMDIETRVYRKEETEK